ncbi:MAG TPA: class I SAM-dependent methyltransferase [Actinomycetota bacterium]|nr:class I SAM-dependent methyltransferase [Actinomycetota bacterium]
MSALLGLDRPAAAPLRLRTDRGGCLPLHVDRWFGPPSVAELDLLGRAVPDVLDLGCGPGRHTIALMASGVPALGVDLSPRAVLAARARGARVLRASVFDRLPNEGSWGTALLLDGNVGIGGDPRALFGRIRALLRPGGRVLVELDAPGDATERMRVALEIGDRRSAWFAWARVSVDGVERPATDAGLRVVEIWTAEGRWFGGLDR